jgi:hypothetical protein
VLWGALFDGDVTQLDDGHRWPNAARQAGMAIVGGECAARAAKGITRVRGSNQSCGLDSASMT